MKKYSFDLYASSWGFSEKAKSKNGKDIWGFKQDSRNNLGYVRPMQPIGSNSFGYKKIRKGSR